MFHYRKDFTNLTRDYAAQDEAGLPEITPVVIADDASHMVDRTYPIFAGTGTMAATAAVFGSVGLEATIRPIQVLAIGLSIPGAGTDIAMILAEATIITANASLSTAFTGLERGLAAGDQADILQGTAAAVSAVSLKVWDATSTHEVLVRSPLLPLTLRRSEIVFIQNVTANTACQATFFWKELTYPLQANPTNLA